MYGHQRGLLLNNYRLLAASKTALRTEGRQPRPDSGLTTTPWTLKLKSLLKRISGACTNGLAEVCLVPASSKGKRNGRWTSGKAQPCERARITREAL